MKPRPALLVRVAVIVLLGLGPAAAQAPSDEAAVARIDALAERFLSGPGAAGLSGAVARGDEVVQSKGYGLADLEHGVPATEVSLGFSSVLADYPRERLSVAVASNSDAVASKLVEQQIAREALGIVPAFADPTLPAAEVEALTGAFQQGGETYMALRVS